MEQSILQGISWSFIGDQFSTIEKFEEQLEEEDVELSHDVLISDSEVNIYYEYVDEEDEDHEIEFTLKADNGASFGGIELLYKIHNEVVEALDDNDYHFFEGLNLLEVNASSNIKTFDLLLGS